MPPTAALLELTDRELSSVTGGFLPLLGLLGMGANLAGSIMGGIGKSKAQEAQAITAAAGSGQSAGAGASPAADAGQSASPAAPATSSDLLAPRAPASTGCSGCSCGG